MLQGLLSRLPRVFGLVVTVGGGLKPTQSPGRPISSPASPRPPTWLVQEK